MPDFDHLLVNWIRALGLFLVAANPTGWSYIGWISHRPDLPASLVFLVGFLIFLGFAAFFRQAMKNLKGGGILILSLIFYLIAINIHGLTRGLPWLEQLSADWLLVLLTSLMMATAVSIRR